jgi:hypothetical protein
MSEQKVTLSLTKEELNKVLAGLNQLPHGQVAELFNNVRIQAVAQLAQPAADKPAE